MSAKSYGKALAIWHDNNNERNSQSLKLSACCSKWRLNPLSFDLYSIILPSALHVSCSPGLWLYKWDQIVYIKSCKTNQNNPPSPHTHTHTPTQMYLQTRRLIAAGERWWWRCDRIPPAGPDCPGWNWTCCGNSDVTTRQTRSSDQTAGAGQSPALAHNIRNERPKLMIILHAVVTKLMLWYR
jgi:hypothetical protein